MTDTAKIRKGYVLFGGHDLHSHITAIEVNRPDLSDSEKLSILREKDKDFPFEWSNVMPMWIANVDGVDYYLEDLA
jgi:hypothetical protein